MENSHCTHSSDDYAAITQMLEAEMTLAMGCTEPAAIALAAARAGALLHGKLKNAKVWLSRDLIKNAQSVAIPHAEGGRGIEMAAAIGLAHANPSKGLCLLEDADENTVRKAEALVRQGCIDVQLLEGAEGLHLVVSVCSEEHTALVEVAGGHTDVVREEVDGVQRLCGAHAAVGAEASWENHSLQSIFEYAENVPLEQIEALCQRQLDCNMAIARQGLSGEYGLNVGATLLQENAEIWNAMRAYAAAGSDARMAGCPLPVVINAGSGNQGITIAVPLAVYAQKYEIKHERLIRAVALANLVSLYIKSGIGRLSSFCGAVSASCACACGLAYLRTGQLAAIEHTIVNTLANISGILCDGAKASCAEKIASSLDAAFMGMRLAENGRTCTPGSGIVAGRAEDVIRAVWRIGAKGMSQTDAEVIGIMMER